MSDYNQKQPLIAVVGSLNMDLVVKTDTIPEEGETVSGEELHYLAGGKGANQAVAASRLGGQTTMIGAVGSDGFGERLLHSLTESGADASQVRILEDTVTGTASIWLSRGDNRIIVIPGANGQVVPEMLEEADTVKSLTAAAAVLLQLEIPLPAVTRAAQLAAEGSALVVLNPAPAVPGLPPGAPAVRRRCHAEPQRACRAYRPGSSAAKTWMRRSQSSPHPWRRHDARPRGGCVRGGAWWPRTSRACRRVPCARLRRKRRRYDRRWRLLQRRAGGSPRAR